MASVWTYARLTADRACVVAVAALLGVSCDSACPGESVQVGDRCEVRSADEPTGESAMTQGGQTMSPADSGQMPETAAADSGTAAPERDACTPSASNETCNDQDDDCDGQVDEGCECVDGAEEECAGNTRGECRPGRRTCRDGKWEACSGRVEPKTSETACDGKDEDCNGTVDNDAPCPSGESCMQGRCRSGCDANECASSGTVCQPKVCEAGQCVNGPPATANTLCQSSDAPVGYCEAGSCMRDSNVICRVGNLDTTQLMFTDSYAVAAPGNVDAPANGFSCRTEHAGQPIVWDLFGDFQNENGVPSEAVYPRGKDTVCTSGDVCAKWFGNPRTKDSGATVECFLFDDDRTNVVGPVRQLVPSDEGVGHPENPDGRPHATMCSPNNCRKWLGDCRVR